LFKYSYFSPSAATSPRRPSTMTTAASKLYSLSIF